MKTAALLVTSAVALKIREGVNNPVTRVVNILKKMEAQANVEKSNDGKIYKDAVCYCDKESAAARKGIEDSTNALRSHNGKVENARAEVARLKEEIAEDDQFLVDKEAELKALRTDRDIEYKEFNEKYQEVTSFIGSLKSAITVLEQKFGDVSHKIKTAGSMADAITEGNAQLLAISNSKLIKADVATALGSLLQNKMSDSGGSQILGMIKSMYENFDNENTDRKKEEDENRANFEDSEGTFEKQIAERRQTRLENRKNRGNQMMLMENSEAIYSKQEEKLALNTQKENTLKVDCATLAQDYAKRTDIRTQELDVLAQVIEMLNSDEATSQFQKGFGFMQLSSRSNSNSRASAAAKKLMSLKGAAGMVALLQQGSGMKYFTAVIEQINGMVGDIKAEMADQKNDRDACRTSISKRTIALQTNTNELEIATRELEATTSNLASNAQQTAETEADRKEAQDAMTTSQVKRVESSVNSQNTLRELEGSIIIIRAADDMLKEFYRGKSAPKAFLQTNALPMGFDGGNQKQAAGDVFSVLEKIIGETNEEIAATIQATNDDARSFQDDWLSNQKLRNGASQTLSKLNQMAAEMKLQKSAQSDTRDNESDQTTQSTKSLGAKKQECSFLLDHFDTLQSAQYDEISTLNEATQILRGSM